MVFLEEKVVMSEASLYVICHWECVRWCRLNRVPTPGPSNLNQKSIFEDLDNFWP